MFGLRVGIQVPGDRSRRARCWFVGAATTNPSCLPRAIPPNGLPSTFPRRREVRILPPRAAGECWPHDGTHFISGTSMPRASITAPAACSAEIDNAACTAGTTEMTGVFLTGLILWRLRRVSVAAARDGFASSGRSIAPALSATSVRDMSKTVSAWQLLARRRLSAWPDADRSMATIRDIAFRSSARHGEIRSRRQRVER